MFLGSQPVIYEALTGLINIVADTVSTDILDADFLDVTDITATNISAQNISGSNFFGGYITTSTGSFIYIETVSITGSTAYFPNITNQNLNTQNVTGYQSTFIVQTAGTGIFQTIDVNTVQANIVNAQQTNSTVINSSSINATGATISSISNSNLDSLNISTSNISGVKGLFTSINAATGVYQQIIIGTGSFSNLFSTTAIIGTGSFDYLTANTGTFNELLINNTLVVDGTSNLIGNVNWGALLVSPNYPSTSGIYLDANGSLVANPSAISSDSWTIKDKFNTQVLTVNTGGITSVLTARNTLDDGSGDIIAIKNINAVTGVFTGNLSVSGTSNLIGNLTANTGTFNELMVNNTLVVDGIATFNNQPLSWEGYGINASYVNASSTGYFNGLLSQKNLIVGNQSDSQIWFNGNINAQGNYGHNMLELYPGGSSITAQNIYGIGMASGEMQYNIDTAGAIHRFLCDGINQGTIGNGSKWITNNNTLDDGSGDIIALKNINAVTGVFTGNLSIGNFLTSLQGVSPVIQNQQPLNIPLVVGYNYSAGLSSNSTIFVYTAPGGLPSFFRVTGNLCCSSYSNGTISTFYEYEDINTNTFTTIMYGSNPGSLSLEDSLTGLGNLNYFTFGIELIAGGTLTFKTENSGTATYNVRIHIEQLTNSQ